MANSQASSGKNNRSRNLLLFLVGILLLGCCGIYALGRTASRVESANSEIERILQEGQPAQPTRRPQPTSIPATFATIRLSGRGDDVVSLSKPDVPAIIELSHSGSSNFAVLNYDRGGNRIDLLVNEIGAYNGTRPLDFGAGELTARLEIQADGPWTITVKPLSSAPSVRVPTSSLSGQGDAVYILAGQEPDTATFSHSGDSNFAVIAYGNSRRLLVNEIGRYEGTVIMQRDALVLEIQADGRWQATITGH